jgi:hypothetical protein
MAGASAKNPPERASSETTPTIAEADTALLAAPGRKPTTRKRYAIVFEHFGESLGPDRRLGTISQEDFARYADSVTANDAWSNETKRDYITTAQQLFAHFEARITTVPKISITGLKPKQITSAGQDRDAFTLAEYRVLFANAATYRANQRVQLARYSRFDEPMCGHDFLRVGNDLAISWPCASGWGRNPGCVGVYPSS